MKNLMLIAAVALLLSIGSRHAAAHGPYVTYYAPPVYVAPAPMVVTRYYAPAPVVAYQPVPVYRTRYRPILGRTVTRVTTRYAPVVIGY